MTDEDHWFWEKEDEDDGGHTPVEGVCEVCDGTGYDKFGEPCNYCGGEGVIYDDE